MPKMILGTVQFGLPYEIDPKYGKVEKAEAFKILDYALSNGIDTIDTAYAYGDAETLLGEYGLPKHVKITTKLEPNCMTGTPYRDRPRLVMDNLMRSLDRLKVPSVETYLLHTPSYVYDRYIIEGLEWAVYDGLTKKIGASVYQTMDARTAIDNDSINVIQMPYSLMDQRAVMKCIVKEAQETGTEIQVRSVFLKGILTRPFETLPSKVTSTLTADLFKYYGILLKYGIRTQEAALLMVLSEPEIDSIVFGVHTLEQLKENLEIAKMRIGFRFCKRELEDAFGNRAYSIPSLWS